MKIFRRITSLLLASLFAFSFAGCNKNDKDNSNVIEPATYEYEYRDLAEPVYIKAADTFAGGSGTEEDPYQISTAEELAYLSELINNSKVGSDYRKAYYKLTADISINEGSNADTWASVAPEYSWNPIGIYYYSFEGVFDGGDHTISGLFINVDCRDDQTTNKYGLFGNNDGVIKNVNIENSYICISGLSRDIGSIAGDNGKEGIITNCKSNAIIDCYDAVCGGIVGTNYGLVETTSYSGAIKELRDYTYNYLGGIAGKSSGTISNCINNGTITSGLIAIDYAGGIVGRLDDGKVDHCINNGILDCDNGEAVEDRPIDTFGNKVGGIVGCLYSSKIGGNEYSNKDISVSNCENNGDIFSGMMAAGIVASASNSGSDYFVRINNCINNAKIVSGSSQAGIVADASCSGAELTISECTNTAAISDGLSAGIVCKLTPTSGNVSITECVNSGDIQSSELYAGGIIRSVYVFGDISAKLLVNGCSNTGKITTPESGGGIIGFINSTGTLSVSDEASLKINSCVNKGEIFTYSSNSFIGGIVGGFGLKGVPSEITNCINTGTLSVDDKAPL